LNHRNELCRIEELHVFANFQIQNFENFHICEITDEIQYSLSNRTISKIVMKYFDLEKLEKIYQIRNTNFVDGGCHEGSKIEIFVKN